MELPVKDNVHDCQACIYSKSRHEPAKGLIHELKDTPGRPGQILGLDILVASKSEEAKICGVLELLC